MYGLFSEGEPFRVFARRESPGTNALVLKFECKEGMGILGLRKSGRTDPVPAPAYEEEDIDPGALRAGRFVHVLPSGQRQSYALSRISSDVAGRMPIERWVELKPHTEYGFRYLVVPETDLDGTTASVRVTPPLPPRAELEEHTFDLTPPPKEPTGPVPREVVREAMREPAREAMREPAREAPREPAREPAREVSREVSRELSRDLPPRPRPPSEPPRDPNSLPPPQSAMAPAIADAALRLLTREQAIEYLKNEMQKVHLLQQRVAELETAARKGRQREKDLLELLSKWENS